MCNHRSDKAIYIDSRPVEDGAYDHHIRRIAPEACAYHNVWFDPRDIEDIRVHGMRSLEGDGFKD